MDPIPKLIGLALHNAVEDEVNIFHRFPGFLDNQLITICGFHTAVSIGAGQFLVQPLLFTGGKAGYYY